MATMTLEEAAQAILEGPYTTCLRCDGKGFPPTKDANANFLNTCHGCKGTGKWLRADYRLACALLGREVPERVVKPSSFSWSSKSELSVPYFSADAHATASLFRREYLGEWRTTTHDDD